MSFGIANHLVDFAFYEYEEKNALVSGNISSIKILYNDSNNKVVTPVEQGIDYANQAEMDWLRRQQDFRKYRR